MFFNIFRWFFHRNTAKRPGMIVRWFSLFSCIPKKSNSLQQQKWFPKKSPKFSKKTWKKMVEKSKNRKISKNFFFLKMSKNAQKNGFWVQKHTDHFQNLFSFSALKTCAFFKKKIFSKFRSHFEDQVISYSWKEKIILKTVWIDRFDVFLHFYEGFIEKYLKTKKVEHFFRKH